MRIEGLLKSGGSWNSRCSLSKMPVIKRIDRLLIANRGEIAVRIMKTCRKMSIETIGVYSDADKRSLHTKFADKAYHIGAAPSLESYLNIDKIVNTAIKARCQAIHPGYGFLSENAKFADCCASEGLIFVGPSSQAIRDMGAKNVSKQIMFDAGIPIINGYHGKEQSDECLLREAEKIGYPIMIKAVCGGGGKGMRIAWDKSEFKEKLKSAQSEAMKAFGNDEMIVEKFVEKPRHVEVQIFGDHHGNCVYLWERDCSIQRRHQKIIEEAPAPAIDDYTRKQLGESAVRAASAVSYVGAGTVEFIMNRQKEFFFMEMNTRLQVEHPVSEAITGTDLVEWQLKVAQGERLPLLQSDIHLNGHAIEARIYAEDTRAGFIPIAGSLKHIFFPSNARIDTGVQQGDEVSVYYDPMIAKIIVWGENRLEAIKKLERALNCTHIAGFSTNVTFMRSILNHDHFIKGNVCTEFINEHEEELFSEKNPSEVDICEAIVSKLLFDENQLDRNNLFLQNDYFRLNHTAKVDISIDGHLYNVEIFRKRKMVIKVGMKSFKISVDEVDRFDEQIKFIMEIQNEKRKVKAVTVDKKIIVFGDEHREYSLLRGFFDENTTNITNVGAIAPMPGVIEKILVQPGDSVTAGQSLIVMVAMKMEYIIRAPYDAVIHSILCKVGDTVRKNANLVKFNDE
ncbi:unnamed protein product [Dracunculus medinensis]|uniref:Methylcrotonoyl-CoA carboxylase subunit alpha, mitochondrial n=1 Tax=Dracunculus medinensis TaxID=318479 RepID=A0A0N4UNA8_DRAME|nr:unnamed protein product [Dracunculus medinensis]